jgi:signal transduction histidine kinase
MSKKGTILIVDDNLTNLSVLFDSLEGVGFRVLVATNGEAALAGISQTLPDIILLDVQMPGIDGFEMCRRLKASETTRNIPVIFMTALTESVDEVKGLRLGAVDYITKPIRVETVLARINTHLTIRNLQRSLQKQNAELAAYDHTVAHDLKNPLALIIGYAEALVEDTTAVPDEMLVKYLRIIARSSRKMRNIIDELLLLSGLRDKKVEMTPLDMGSIVVEARQRLAAMIEKRKAEIVLPPSWPVAMGYGPWVEEVWANYISNAVKYGANPPHVELGADVGPTAGTVRFWARDNGPGLTLEEQGRLFKPFEQLGQVRAEGHGLGLSIVLRIVEKLGGEVDVESRVGEGSVFSFTLPAGDTLRTSE